MTVECATTIEDGRELGPDRVARGAELGQQYSCLPKTGGRMLAPAEGVRHFRSDEPDGEHGSPSDMAWMKPQYGSGETNSAGKLLISDEDVPEEEWNHALTVINNWRACHGYPLLAMRMTLTGRAKKIDSRAIIAQRLKRLSSIAIKLGRNEHMALSQMQDIGGCRAVVGTVRQLDRLARAYDHETKAGKAEFIKKFDYVQLPKKDGYRSIHFVYKYRTHSRPHRVWDGLRVEIQLRSRLQHAWATAVETVDTFTRQSIKTGGGKEAWRRFFLLMGTAIAIMERRPPCPDCPSEIPVLTAELKQLVQTLNVRSVLRGWSRAMKYLPSKTTNKAAVYLLYLDATEGGERIKITGFTTSGQAKASETYLSTEKMIRDKPNLQAVLVSAHSLQALRSAFPNYFADTRVFIKAVNEALTLS